MESQSPIQLLLSIAQIPSPTGKEFKKAHFIKKHIAKLGFKKVLIDEVGNCIVHVPSTAKSAKTILVVAHIDTACDPGEKVAIREDKKYLYGHGVCDNSAGVTGVLITLSLLQQKNLRFPNTLLFAFTVGEEGLGAKRGMKHIIKQYGKKIDAVVNVESHNLGRVTNQAIGQYRCKVTVQTELGGHSYRDFGRPNANVILANVVSDFSRSTLFQRDKKVTFNIGQLKGEGSINVISKVASCLLEIRSEDNSMLKKAVQIFQKVTQKVNNAKVIVEVTAETPAVTWPISDRIFQLTMDAQRQLGVTSKVDAGNTDGDVSLAHKIPTVTIGTSIGWNTHSLDEYLEKKSFAIGVKQVTAVIQKVASDF